MSLHITIPMSLPSLANTRWHWSKLAGVKAKQKKAVLAVLTIGVDMRLGSLPPMPLMVTITRIGKRKLDDDNLQGAAKAVRDAIAEFVGVDDGDAGWTWKYEQRIGKEYAVEISIESLTRGTNGKS